MCTLFLVFADISVKLSTVYGKPLNDLLSEFFVGRAACCFRAYTLYLDRRITLISSQ